MIGFHETYKLQLHLRKLHNPPWENETYMKPVPCRFHFRGVNFLKKNTKKICLSNFFLAGPYFYLVNILEVEFSDSTCKFYFFFRKNLLWAYLGAFRCFLGSVGGNISVFKFIFVRVSTFLYILIFLG